MSSSSVLCPKLHYPPLREAPCGLKNGYARCGPDYDRGFWVGLKRDRDSINYEGEKRND